MGRCLFTVGTLIASVDDERPTLCGDPSTYPLARSEGSRSGPRNPRRRPPRHRPRGPWRKTASQTKSAFLTKCEPRAAEHRSRRLSALEIISRRLDDLVFPAVETHRPEIDRAMRQIGEGSLDIISTEGERLTTMINDVLDLAKIESGRMDVRVPIQVEELVLRASAATSSLISHAGLSLVTDIEPDLPTIVGDRDRLIQVVINLISNAVKFTPVRDDHLQPPALGRVGRARRSPTQASASRRRTRDTVFEQFRQAGDTLTDKPRGDRTGTADLSRDRGAPRRSNLGRVSARRRFHVRVYATRPGGRKVGRTEDGEPIASGIAGDRNGERPQRVLVVEDDRGTRGAVRQALEANGFAVDVAPDGRRRPRAPGSRSAGGRHPRRDAARPRWLLRRRTHEGGAAGRRSAGRRC